MMPGAGARRIAVARHRAANRGGNAQQHADDGGHRGLVEFIAHARQMAAGDVPGLMRQNADRLVRRLRLEQQAGVNEDALAARHEGVDARILDQIDPDRLGIDARRLEDGAGIEAQQPLDLGIADERHVPLLREGAGHKRRPSMR